MGERGGCRLSRRGTCRVAGAGSLGGISLGESWPMEAAGWERDAETREDTGQQCREAGVER